MSDTQEQQAERGQKELKHELSQELIVAKDISKSFPQGRETLDVLKGISISINAGDAVCIRGASGAGKSTLLHILGTLDRPTRGEVLYKGEGLLSKSDDELADFRNKKMGFVFQFHHLMSEFTALENVMMPCRIAGESKKIAREKAEGVLKEMQLESRMSHYPSEMSGGEQQRVAVARALVQKPEILFADEPTGNLDTHNSQRVQELFFELKSRYGLTLIVVSHDLDFARRFPRVLSLKDGQWS